MRILRCELCEKPCTLTTLDQKEILFCPVFQKPAEWRLVNTPHNLRQSGAVKTNPCP